jgi:hypothetical protein
METLQNPVPIVRRPKDMMMMRLLALLAIAWAGTWLLLIVVPTGEVGAVDRTYDLMFVPFGLPGSPDLLVRRFIELVCLLPAAAFLVMAQAIQKRRLERRHAAAR